MKKHLFLTVSPGDGGVELICETLGPALSMAGGYWAERLDPHGESLKVALRPAAAAAGVEGFGAPLILERRGGLLRKDNEVWRDLGTRLLQEALYYPYSVLLPLGGYELVIPQYRQALAELLSSELPLAGALLRREDAASLGKELGLGERYLMLVDRLHEALRDDADSFVLDPAALGEASARRILTEWAREYVF